MSDIVELPFLNGVPVSALIGHLERSLVGFELPVAKTNGRATVYSMLFAIHGFDVLQSADLRRLLLLSLPEPELRGLGVRLGVSEGIEGFDLAMELSHLPWRSGSGLVGELADIFSIGEEFLPGPTSREVASEMVEPVMPLPPLFSYQNEIVGEVATFLAEPRGAACLVQLPTGAGKTRVAVEGVARWLMSAGVQVPSVSVLWMAHSEELCDQACEAFIRVWGATGSYGLRLTRLWGGHQPSPAELRGAFVVAGYQKAIALAGRSSVELERWLDKIDLVVIDEAHKALAPTVDGFLSRVRRPQTKLLGLTATPGRDQYDSAENRKLAALFDRRLLTSQELGDNPLDRLRELGVLAPVERRVIQSEVRLPRESEAGWVDDVPPKVLKRLARDESRNELILDEVVAQVKANRPTLVFCCSVEHARLLAMAAASRSVRTAFLDCNMSRDRRRKVIEAFRAGTLQALFNYGVLSTGFDAPNIRCVIIARPTSSIVLYSQMVGRGIRGPAVGGSADFLLVDVKDHGERFGGVDAVYSHFESFWRSD